MPEHLVGVIFAYDDDKKVLVCIPAKAGFSLPWLARMGWKASHEGLRASLPLLEPRVQLVRTG